MARAPVEVPSPAGANPPTSLLVDEEGNVVTALDAGRLRSRIGDGRPFWLDLFRPGPAEYRLLSDAFGFHPLAVEDAEHFGQRPKLEDYDDFVYLVLYGADPEGGRLVEVHCFFSPHYLVTVHRDDCPSFAELRDRHCRRRVPVTDELSLLYRVADGLVDSFFPVLAQYDDKVDAVQDDILVRPREEQLGRLFDMKRSLLGLRKVLGPQRDLFASLLAGASELPGMTPDSERYFRDVYDHLIRIGDLADSYRDLVNGAMDVYLSTVSNRLNQVMKQLTIIATVFLPLSFVTGFFGQNFGWMVDRLGGLPVFLGAGIGTELFAVTLLVVLGSRRGWVGGG
ncbi:MAG: magnesium transporter CorA family protein [Acidimicrobiales bacterium]